MKVNNEAQLKWQQKFDLPDLVCTRVFWPCSKRFWFCKAEYIKHAISEVKVISALIFDDQLSFHFQQIVVHRGVSELQVMSVMCQSLILKERWNSHPFLCNSEVETDSEHWWCSFYFSCMYWRSGNWKYILLPNFTSLVYFYNGTTTCYAVLLYLGDPVRTNLAVQ